MRYSVCNKEIHMETESITLVEAAKIVAWARKERLDHPVGKFDNAGRWYPAAEENADDFTSGIRSPSREWPYSYMLAARTLKHCKALAAVSPEFVLSRAAHFAERYAAAKNKK